MTTVFVDSGAFIALGVASDERHAAAQHMYNTLLRDGVRLVTSNHVVDETCTWLLRRVSRGHHAALEFGRSIGRAAALADLAELSIVDSSSNSLVVVYSTPSIERVAWDIFARYDTAGFSFTDCVSFAVMQSLDIKKAFTFDAHFGVMGLEML